MTNKINKSNKFSRISINNTNFYREINNDFITDTSISFLGNQQRTNLKIPFKDSKGKKKVFLSSNVFKIEVSSFKRQTKSNTFQSNELKEFKKREKLRDKNDSLCITF